MNENYIENEKKRTAYFMHSQFQSSRQANWTTKVMYCTVGYCKAITTNFSMTFLGSTFPIKYILNRI